MGDVDSLRRKDGNVQGLKNQLFPRELQRGQSWVSPTERQ